MDVYCPAPRSGSGGGTVSCLVQGKNKKTLSRPFLHFINCVFHSHAHPFFYFFGIAIWVNANLRADVYNLISAIRCSSFASVFISSIITTTYSTRNQSSAKQSRIDGTHIAWEPSTVLICKYGSHLNRSPSPIPHASAVCLLHGIPCGYPFW